MKFEVFKQEKIKLPNSNLLINFRKNTSDHLAFRHVFLLNEYENLRIKNARWIIDAGANIGLFSMYIRTKYPDANIIALEPEPSNFKQLEKNLKGFKNVFLENKGLWKNDCRLAIIEKIELGKWGTQVQESENGTIEAVSIEALIEKYKIGRIDLLKIDIETSEKYIFENYKKWLHKVNTVIIEFHDRLLEGTSRPFFEAILDDFKRFQFSLVGDNIMIERIEDNR